MLVTMVVLVEDGDSRGEIERGTLVFDDGAGDGV